MMLSTTLTMIAADDECASTLRANPCASHDGREAYCVLNALTLQDVSILSELFASAVSTRCDDHCNNPCQFLNGMINEECGGCIEPTSCRPGALGFPWPPSKPRGTDAGMTATCSGAGADVCEDDEPLPVLWQSLPRGSHPDVDRIASRLEALSVEANEATRWGFTLETGAASEGQGQQPMLRTRYTLGGECVAHRDAIGPPTEEICESLAAAELAPRDEPSWTCEWDHRMGRVEALARRMVGIVVQLATRRDDGVALSNPEQEYTGGELILRLGTANEPALAQRLRGGGVINAIRRNATRLHAPTCPGDAIFFPGLTVHEVLPVRAGTRTALVWWVLGHPPPDSTTSADVEEATTDDARQQQAASPFWADRSPWDREMARELDSDTARP